MIGVGDKVQVSAGTICRFRHLSYRTDVSFEGEVTVLDTDYALILPSKESDYARNIFEDERIRYAWVAVKDLIKVETHTKPEAPRFDQGTFEVLSQKDKPTGFISIGFVWRVIAIRAHESDDTKAEITITGGESESVDGAVYLTVTRAEAKAIHLGDVYVVTIRKQG